MPSFILIRETVWPQYTDVTDRQGRPTDRTGQLSDSIELTVLQTVAQKSISIKTKLEAITWLYCVECPQYSTRLEALAYLYVSSNTVSPALRPTSVPSGILIHSAIWPQ